MSCGCKKKKSNNVVLRKIDNKENVTMSSMVVEAHLKGLQKTLKALLPIMNFLSTDDTLCLDCCYKHLSKANAYYDEAKISEYRENIFKCIGQIGLAETHVRDKEELLEGIRIERLKLMEEGKEPDWKKLLDLLEKYRQTP